MLRNKFEILVVNALAGLPLEFKELLDNIDIVVEDWPSSVQLRKMKLRNKYELLGLYEGVPITQRDQGYNLVLPDKITIFQKPLEAQCRSLKELRNEIASVVEHEIAHHFGIDDQRLNEIEREKRK
jgi:predicted Zn-dependent protease with MMP-like domain